MKILYQLEITKETGFRAKDFPDRFEILREGKTPLVFKPVAIKTQEMYSRLDEAEALLRQTAQSEGRWFLNGEIDDYFKRHL